jgi:hypothetical protein
VRLLSIHEDSDKMSSRLSLMRTAPSQLSHSHKAAGVLGIATAAMPTPEMTEPGQMRHIGSGSGVDAPQSHVVVGAIMERFYSWMDLRILGMRTGAPSDPGTREQPADDGGPQ